jgi:N6-L-threonylcarbamoyladenine synthase
MILGIDTSCDDTSLALLDTNGKVLANVISSQTAAHAPHGGIVPELASRSHMDVLPRLYTETLRQANISEADLSGIAVTHTPGLIGCLLVGVCFAKALAYRLKIPLFAVNHLDGHLFSPFLTHSPAFPFLGLVVSGGHTAFYQVKAFDDICLVGQTVDDAAGEAFDKTAKQLGLGYPGGAAIEKMAIGGNPQQLTFRTARVKMGKQYLSFSGLKTAVAQAILKQPPAVGDLPHWCASIQDAIIKQLADKMAWFLSEFSYKAFALSGGVAMNTALREHLGSVCLEQGIDFLAADKKYCTDNAAMIAYAAFKRPKLADIFLLNPQATQKIQARQLAKDMNCGES